MKKHILAVAFFLSLAVASFAEETIAAITTLKGETYTNVRVVAKVKDTVKIMHNDGIKTLKISELNQENAKILGGEETPEQANLRQQKEAKARELYRQEVAVQQAKAAKKRVAREAEEEAIARQEAEFTDEQWAEWRENNQRFQEEQRENLLARMEREDRERKARDAANEARRRYLIRLNKLKRELNR